MKRYFRILEMIPRVLVSPLPDLGEKISVYCEGFGTNIWMCCKKTQRTVPDQHGTLDSFAVSLTKTIVIIDSLTLDVTEYNTNGCGYIFLYKYDDYTFGLVMELTENNEYRTTFPKSHYLYSRILDL